MTALEVSDVCTGALSPGSIDLGGGRGLLFSAEAFALLVVVPRNLSGDRLRFPASSSVLLFVCGCRLLGFRSLMLAVRPPVWSGGIVFNSCWDLCAASSAFSMRSKPPPIFLVIVESSPCMILEIASVLLVFPVVRVQGSGLRALHARLTVGEAAQVGAVLRRPPSS